MFCFRRFYSKWVCCFLLWLYNLSRRIFDIWCWLAIINDLRSRLICASNLFYLFNTIKYCVYDLWIINNEHVKLFIIAFTLDVLDDRVFLWCGPSTCRSAPLTTVIEKTIVNTITQIKKPSSKAWACMRTVRTVDQPLDDIYVFIFFVYKVYNPIVTFLFNFYFCFFITILLKRSYLFIYI